MLVAVQGCSHGCLSAIYDSVHQYEQIHNRKVELLLLCGDFQALRNKHDFASLAVPPKFHALGTFHEYYAGKKKAPVLTLVIGGNHEASNYMWELYHGGWLAPNIYYLGAAGSVLVDGLRVVGASGIYKDHDYSKGHFETVPYNNSTLRSAYHIRSYDVSKLMQLSQRDHTIFMSHDWPVTIPRHGNTGPLLRKKPFFKQEVETDTLGSPPLLGLMRHIQPDHWFSAHLHVKFAAVYEHASANGTVGKGSKPSQASSGPAVMVNPDEIKIDDDEDFDDPPVASGPPAPASANGVSSGNPDEIAIEDDEFDGPPISAGEAKEALKVDESADLVEAVRAAGDAKTAANIIGTTHPIIPAVEIEAGPSRTRRTTKFLALDKCGPHRDFIQFLEIPTSLSSSPSGTGAERTTPRLTFDPEWLAISRALHPFLSLNYHATPLPHPDQLQELIATEKRRIEGEGLLVPERDWNGDDVPPLVWEKGLVDVERVQRFWPTAPAEGEPGGSPSAWYTNPQTEAFCGMLGISNRINPAPSQPTPNGKPTEQA